MTIRKQKAAEHEEDIKQLLAMHCNAVLVYYGMHMHSNYSRERLNGAVQALDLFLNAWVGALFNELPGTFIADFENSRQLLVSMNPDTAFEVLAGMELELFGEIRICRNPVDE